MNVILYFLLLLSIVLETSKNIFSNTFSKNILKTETDIYKFNFFMYIGSTFVLMFFKVNAVSTYTIILAVFFALAIWLNQYFFLKALKCGTMSFTTFIQGASLLIPIVFGVIAWKEKITVLQIILLLIIVLSMALSLGIKKESINLKWLIFSFLAMSFLGVIGILQTIHQASNYSNELFAFLRYAFIFSVLINFVGWQIAERKQKSNFSVRGSAIIQAGSSGAFMGLVHIINLYLAGTLPKVIFFPIINGGLIFITLIADIIFFKEKLSIKQWIGILAGTIALGIIGI